MEKNSGHDEENGKNHLTSDRYSDFEPSPLPPMAPDGGPIPGAGIDVTEPLPVANPKNMICLRGPCEHYWELETIMETGNTKGTWEALGVRAPRQIHRVCLVNQGYETDLTESLCLECSRWNPMSKTELSKLAKRRDLYFKEHPEHKEDNDAVA